MKPQRIVEDLGLAQRLKEVEREFEVKESQYRNTSISQTQVERFYKKWKGKLYYQEEGR
ncbi:hypothetical protein LCGC14_2801730 [marine sediment metagenome]|uniref:Uncharacterized protein n=1 Tax=marine sediment metagenome TaxID=412755 RepID=A0A0F9AVX1_9ZZZZ